MPLGATVVDGIINVALLASFAYLAYAVLIQGRAVPNRQWATVIVLVVITYPWDLVTRLVGTHVEKIGLASYQAHPAHVLRELQPVFWVWHYIPLIAALIVGFSILKDQAQRTPA